MPLNVHDNTEADDLRQRTQYSLVSVKLVAPFALGWWIAAYLLDAPLLSTAAGIATLGVIGGIALHHFQWHLAARVFWLGATNVAVALASFVTPPEGHMSFIFIATAIGPFVIFSPRTEKLWFSVMLIAPISLWFVGWATDYSLVGYFEVSAEAADRVLSPATAVTLFGTVLFVIAYFVHVTRRNAQSLREARRQAEQSSEAKSNLMRSVSHEMLTPLHAISGFAEFLHSDAKAGRNVRKEQLEEYSAHIMSASNTLQLIIENIFDFANWNAEETSEETMRVSVHACLNPVIQRFAGALSNKTVTLDNLVRADLNVVGNPIWLAAIFKQLLDNAIKFAKPGGRISIRAHAKDDDTVEIVFKDDGPGFPAGRASAAFAAFERLAHETGTTAGVGVGLPLAQNFAKAMGGLIVIDESVSDGARVRLVLPMAAAE